MDATARTSHNLFEVYLRLRPPPSGGATTERILTVEPPETNAEKEQREKSGASHITLNPPTDRRRAIEKFAFTRVFEEEASQLDVFHRAEVLPLVEGVVAPNGGEGTDAMVATLGVTGSGKVSRDDSRRLPGRAKVVHSRLILLGSRRHTQSSDQRPSVA